MKEIKVLNKDIDWTFDCIEKELDKAKKSIKRQTVRAALDIRSACIDENFRVEVEGGSMWLCIGDEKLTGKSFSDLIVDYIYCSCLAKDELKQMMVEIRTALDYVESVYEGLPYRVYSAPNEPPSVEGEK